MKAYFIRRLLLIPFTLLAITFLVFMITRFAPGGPLESALQEAALGSEGKSSSGGQESSALTPEMQENLEEYYGFDRPFLESYLVWLGVLPREDSKTKSEFAEDATETKAYLAGSLTPINIVRNGDTLSGTYEDGSPLKSPWKLRLETTEDRQKRWKERAINKGKAEAPPFSDRVVIYKSRIKGLLQGYFGDSIKYNDPVWEMLKARFPIAIFFGLSSTILTYLVCIPLGVAKALRHKSIFDSSTSILVFFGYAIPGFALGAILVVYLGGRLSWFPMQGMTSPNFSEMGWFDQFKDLVHHAVLPLICFVIGSFAFTTMLMKNSLMDNLASDYVRTAVSKGVSFKTAVLKHAFRNSLIPIATNIGHIITIFVAGSMLIERVFDIQGVGLLGYQALMDRDYPIIMAVITLSSFLMLLGNVISDMVVAAIDPRISFS